MSFIWGNSTKSGLCDRLIDLFIIASISKLFNKELYLSWEEQTISDIQKLIWNNIRIDDYKIENVIQYFNFPSIIHFISKEELQNKINNKSEDDILCNIYLGGVYSPFTFYDKFIDKQYNKNNYINIFKNLINQFKPTTKLLNLIKNIPKNLISVHLRRTDKSSKLINADEAQGVDINNMDDLNNKTMELINKFIINDYNNYYFSSDCIDTKINYEDIYSKYNIINYEINIPYEQTYIDLYLMSKSKYIILSQRHSSFSLFCSLINNAKLIYFYEDSILHNNFYYHFNNIIKYEKIGILYFHQGWSDIINCLSLINYYSNIYDKIYLIMRNDSNLLIDFFTKNLYNIIILYEDKNNLDIQKNRIENVINKYKIPLYSDILCIGYHDIFRKDKNKFKYIDNCFVKGFYESYDIPYIVRINNFIFNRNYELEEDTYNNFIKLNGKEYILYHEVIENYDNNIKIVNLDKISNIFFDFIKIIENSIEIHLLDSSWAVFIYLLDCKYKLFSNKKIFLYNKRDYRKMFEDPIKLPNWIIIL